LIHSAPCASGGLTTTVSTESYYNDILDRLMMYANIKKSPQTLRGFLGIIKWRKSLLIYFG